MGAGSGRLGAGAGARGRADAGNRREGRGDGARGRFGGTPHGKGGPLFKQRVPGRPAHPAWAREHAALQGRVAPKTLGIDPRLQGSRLGGTCLERARGSGHIFGLSVCARGAASILK